MSMKTRFPDRYITVIQMAIPTGKLYSVDENGVKKEAAANCGEAWAKTHYVETHQDLKKVIDDHSELDNSSIICGYIKGTEPTGESDDGAWYKLHSASDLKEIAEKEGIEWNEMNPHPFYVQADEYLHAARLKGIFSLSAWYLLDRDLVDEMPIELKPHCSVEEWVQELFKFYPEMKDTSYLVCKSGSSRVELVGKSQAPNNSHIYMLAEHAADVERFGKALLIHAFSRGCGFVRMNYGRDGKEVGARRWTIFDPTTFSRERLIFEGKPRIAEGSQGVLSVVGNGSKVVKGFRDTVNTKALDTPSKDMEKAAGLSLNKQGTGYQLINTTDLTPDTELEVVDRQVDGRRVFITMREFLESGEYEDIGKLRVQSPYRLDSDSVAAYIRKGDFEPFLFDVGTQTNYKYNESRAKFAEFLESYRKTKAINTAPPPPTSPATNNGQSDENDRIEGDGVDNIDGMVDSPPDYEDDIYIPPTYNNTTGSCKDKIDTIIRKVYGKMNGAEEYVDKDVLAKIFANSFYDSKSGRIYMINQDYQLINISMTRFVQAICTEVFGSFFSDDIRDFIKSRGEVAVKGDDGEISVKSEMSDKAVNEAIGGLYGVIIGDVQSYLENRRQREKVTYRTDMFATIPKLIVGKEVVEMISIHEDYPVGYWNNRYVRDYMEQFPTMHDFLDLVCASRFAVDRKKAYLWMQAVSDWGKGFFANTFKSLGMLVEINEPQLKSALKGSPLPLDANTFKHQWILWFDEFKTVNSEMKLINNSIMGSPKNQMRFEAEVFMKLFTSAEHVDALAGEHGVEEQFSNRFSMIKTSEYSLNNREVFNEDRDYYFKAVKSYVAHYINKKVSFYRSLGRREARKYADKILDDYNKQHKIGIEFGSLNDSIKTLAEEISNLILSEFRAKNTKTKFGDLIKSASEEVIYHGENFLLFKNANKLIGDYIDDNVNHREKTKVGFKTTQIRAEMDQSNRKNKNGNVKYKNLKGENKVSKGVLISLKRD